ncbi:MAG: hypothetical protein ACKO3T_01080 [Planctomycetaceae bacterium]
MLISVNALLSGTNPIPADPELTRIVEHINSHDGERVLCATALVVLNLRCDELSVTLVDLLTRITNELTGYTTPPAAVLAA